MFFRQLKVKIHKQYKMKLVFCCILNVIGIFILDLAASQETSLLCFECSNAGSNQHCMKTGEIKRCQPNENACMTEIRRERSGFRAFRITKKCKQALACENNYWQNVGGVRNKPKRTGRQCAGRKGRPFSSSTCRCCCSSNLCNSGLYSACFQASRKRARNEESREPRCQPLEELLVHGKQRCSHSNKPGSHCVFSCNNKYSLFGKTEISCQKKDGVSASWTGSPPCCAKRCPPYGAVDLVIAMQTNIPNMLDWQRLKLFLISILQSFVRVPDSDTRIGLFTFSDKPIKGEEIFLNTRLSGLKDLHRHVFRLQRTRFPGTRNEQLRHVNLNGAVSHAQRYSLSPKRGDRKYVRDFLVLLTYGNCDSHQSSVSIPSRQLRDDGVTILAVNIQPPKSRINQRYMKQLTEISGSRSKIYVINGLNKSLTRLSKPIQDAICGNPCKRGTAQKSEDQKTD